MKPAVALVRAAIISAHAMRRVTEGMDVSPNRGGKTWWQIVGCTGACSRELANDAKTPEGQGQPDPESFSRPQTHCRDTALRPTENDRSRPEGYTVLPLPQASHQSPPGATPALEQIVIRSGRTAPTLEGGLTYHDNLIQSSLVVPLRPPKAIADQFLLNSWIISLSFS
jgi:hypothetical protein